MKSMIDLSIKPVAVRDKAAIEKNNLYNIIPSHPSRTMFLGYSKSGKSNLACNLLLRDEFLAGYYDLIVIVSSTADIDSIWLPVKKLYGSRLKVFDSFNEEIIRSIFERQKLDIDENGLEKSLKILFLFDDIIAEGSKLQNSKVLTQLAIAGRHYNCSLWLITQSYKKIPRVVRLQLNNILIFKVRNSERKILAEEICPSNMKIPIFYFLLDECTKDYGFLYYNGQVENPYQFRHNFDKILQYTAVSDQKKILKKK